MNDPWKLSEELQPRKPPSCPAYPSEAEHLERARSRARRYAALELAMGQAHYMLQRGWTILPDSNMAREIAAAIEETRCL